MGDLNDVCGAKALDILENGGMIDAWSEGGFGYGATIYTPLPYRIDHVFYNDYLQLNRVYLVTANDLSDHDALTCVFNIK